jgi:hypothetical protein
MDVLRHGLGTGELYETLVSIPAYAERHYMLDGVAVAAAASTSISTTTTTTIITTTTLRKLIASASVQLKLQRSTCVPCVPLATDSNV